jgi:DNA polymerase III subunit gamma/tau
VSPFAADSARKSGLKGEMSAEPAPSAPRSTSSTPTPPVVMGSAALDPVSDPVEIAVPAPADKAPAPAGNVDSLRDAVLNALAEAGQRMLVSMLETGEWSIAGNELIVKVASSSTVIDMSVGAEAKRVAIASASGAAGRAMKFKVLPGGTAQAVPARPTTASNGGGRARAEQDPIVRRLQEKFGAEIRTIIDQRDRK